MEDREAMVGRDGPTSNSQSSQGRLAARRCPAAQRRDQHRGIQKMVGRDGPTSNSQSSQGR
ncbi:MAG: hypothetical protein AAFN48_08485, partial [Pseudomonadota bacterium]